GQITFWALLVYLAFRLGDMAVRGQFPGAFTEPFAGLFLTEILLGGVLPLVLLGRAGWRARPPLLLLGVALAAGGVVLNRTSVVLLAMRLKGPMPWTAPSSYVPSLAEWGLSLGLIAATIFLFGAGVRYLPLLPKAQQPGEPAGAGE